MNSGRRDASEITLRTARGQQIKSLFTMEVSDVFAPSTFGFAVRLSVLAWIALYSQILAPIYAIFDRNVHEKYVDLIL